jgi:hypothetical protein
MRRYAEIIDVPRIASSVAVALVLAFLGGVLLHWIGSAAPWFFVFGSIVTFACLRQAFSVRLFRVGAKSEARVLGTPWPWLIAWLRHDSAVRHIPHRREYLRREFDRGMGHSAEEPPYAPGWASLTWIVASLAAPLLLLASLLLWHLAVGAQSVLLAVVEIYLFVIWIWILFTIITDLFRARELSGLWKAAWIVFLTFLPFLAALVYLVVRGNGMRDRAIKAQSDAKRHFDEYVREQTHTSPADELHKLNELREKGALSEAEYARARGKLLSGDPRRRSVS